MAVFQAAAKRLTKERLKKTELSAEKIALQYGLEATAIETHDISCIKRFHFNNIRVDPA